jgi:hypothetical protein
MTRIRSVLPGIVLRLLPGAVPGHLERRGDDEQDDEGGEGSE